MKVDTPTARRKLVPRREPYWHKLTKGRYLGFRKTETGGSWVARLQEDTGKSYQALGDMDFEGAVDAALKWFTHASYVEDRHYRLSDAIRDYVAYLEINNSYRAGRDAELRLKKHLPDSLTRTELTRLTTIQITRWHQSLVRKNGDAEDTRKSKDGANKLLQKLKAALNLAFRNGLVSTDREWRKVKTFKGAGAARTLFLSDSQVISLLDHTQGPFHLLVRAAVLTGARYGELCSVQCEDLTDTLRLSGKTGPRDVYLSDTAQSFFEDLVKGRTGPIFIHELGRPWAKSNQHQLMIDAVKESGLPAETVFYSLRHYHISKALLAGLPALMIARNCGTSMEMIEKHYGKFMPKNVKEMMNSVVLAHC